MSIALVSVVKDEAKTVRQMLDSCRGLVDFVAVLETGSADDTYLICRDTLRSWGVPHVLQTESFTTLDTARNQAIGLVPREPDWILLLDGDEHLLPDEHETWRSLTEGPHDAWLVPRCNWLVGPSLLTTTDYRGRLFRHNGAIRFRSAVPEGLDGYVSLGKVPASANAPSEQCGPHIHHLKYAIKTRRELFDAEGHRCAQRSGLAGARESVSMRSAMLEELYRVARERPSDINEHVPTLYRYASTCRHVTEFGTHAGVSTAAFLYAQPDVLCCYDLDRSREVFDLEMVAATGRTRFEFHQENVGQAEIDPTDLLFIDTKHTYEQMQQELARHGEKARRYLVFHDTEVFGENGETPGNRGIWPAIAEFLRRNDSWRLLEHFTNNHGLTVLGRLA